jgi:hypothetical protein
MRSSKAPPARREQASRKRPSMVDAVLRTGGGSRSATDKGQAVRREDQRWFAAPADAVSQRRM